MRFILLNFILIVLFCSCTSEKSIREESFTPPFTYEIVFSDNESDFEGVLSYDGKEMTFSPYSPKGYSIKIGEKGCEVEYEGLVFTENVLPSSRFLSLFEIMKNLEECKILTDPLTIKKDNVNIIFKEKK